MDTIKISVKHLAKLAPSECIATIHRAYSLSNAQIKHNVQEEIHMTLLVIRVRTLVLTQIGVFNALQENIAWVEL